MGMLDIHVVVRSTHLPPFHVTWKLCKFPGTTVKYVIVNATEMLGDPTCDACLARLAADRIVRIDL